MNLASLPSPAQGVWHLGPIPLRAYAFCIIAGVVLAVWLGERRWVARGGVQGTVLDVAGISVPFGLIGGRLYHVITSPQAYFGEGGRPLEAFAVWKGGLGIWGAILLGTVAAWVACRRRGVRFAPFADALAPGVVLAQAVGRFGNWFNQELYGRPTTLPWALEIDPAHRPAATPDVGLYHPTFAYEALWNVGVAALCLWADRRFKLGGGRVFALYVAGYTVGRFWIEMLRVDPANTVLGLRLNVVTSVVVFLGAVLFLVLRRGAGREDVVQETASDEVRPGDQPVSSGHEDH